jgi:hypothetical protein
MLSLWQCVCYDIQKMQTFCNAIQGPSCRKKQRYILLAFSVFVRQKRRQKQNIKHLLNASVCHFKVLIGLMHFHRSSNLRVLKKSLLLRWIAICAIKRRLRFNFHQVHQSVCRKIQRNVFAALSSFLSAKRNLSVLNGLSVFLTKSKASFALQGAFSSWRTCMKFSRFTSKSVDRIFQKIHNQHSHSAHQKRQLLACWRLAASRSSKGSFVTILIQNLYQRSLGIRIFRLWQQKSPSFFEREHSLFKNRACFAVGQKILRVWAIHVQTRIMKTTELVKRNLQLVVHNAVVSWAFVASLKNKMKKFEFRRLHNRFKRWRQLLAERHRMKAKDTFIMIILAKGYTQHVCRFVFKRWVEYTKINTARSKRQSAAIQLSIKRNQLRLQSAFVTWNRVKTTGFSVKRILSERLRKLFFRWHTFVEYRRSKSLLKSKLQQQSSPPSNSR